jgi:VIT1/CCC1 family predicted Fe2+/Mn2+ transporter
LKVERSQIKRYLAYLEDERNSAAIYASLADLEKDERLAGIYRRLAETEQAHAESWEEKLREAGVEPPKFKLNWRARTLIWLASRLGINAVLPTLVAGENNATDGYSQEPGVEDMSSTERSHARLLRQIGITSRTGVEGGILAQIEGRHRATGGNALRAAVLGASDGLVSNFNLVMGVAGAQLAAGTILLTGFAGLLAGAISMALGEYISVQSSRELYQKQIATEAEEIEKAPDEEKEELVLIYQARGLDDKSARLLAESLMSNKESALATLARDELGVNPEELGGSAWEAAITSFLLFAVGAIVPVIPYLFMEGMPAAAVSAGMSTLGLFLIGAAITLFTGKPVWYSGLRQVAFGLAAAAATFSIGRLIGVTVTG